VRVETQVKAGKAILIQLCQCFRPYEVFQSPNARRATMLSKTIHLDLWQLPHSPALWDTSVRGSRDIEVLQELWACVGTVGIII